MAYQSGRMEVGPQVCRFLLRLPHWQIIELLKFVTIFQSNILTLWLTWVDESPVPDLTGDLLLWYFKISLSISYCKETFFNILLRKTLNDKYLAINAKYISRYRKLRVSSRFMWGFHQQLMILKLRQETNIFY